MTITDKLCNGFSFYQLKYRSRNRLNYALPYDRGVDNIIGWLKSSNFKIVLDKAHLVVKLKSGLMVKH